MTADDRARPKIQIALADLRIGMAQRMPLLSQTRRIASLARRLTTLLPSRKTNTASTPRRCRCPTVCSAHGLTLTAAFERCAGLVQPGSHPDVAPDRQDPDPVLGFSDPFLYDRRPEAYREPWCINSEGLGGQEVSKLMYENHEAEHKYRGEPD